MLKPMLSFDLPYPPRIFLDTKYLRRITKMLALYTKVFFRAAKI